MTSPTTPMQSPSERFRAALLEAILPLAADKGWTAENLKDAAVVAGLSEGELQLATPRGVIDMIDALAVWADDAMEAELLRTDLLSMKVRARVRTAVLARFTALTPHKKAEARAIEALMRPFRAQEAPRIAWRTADRIWRALGDASTDENYYSKRAILSGVLASTMLRWLADDDPEIEATKRFLDSRIENVMQFEKLKAQAAPVVATAGYALGQAAEFVLRRRSA